MTGHPGMREPFMPSREFAHLGALLACRDCGLTTARPVAQLADLVDQALDHIRDTGHYVAVTETSQVVYGPSPAQIEAVTVNG